MRLIPNHMDYQAGVDDDNELFKHADHCPSCGSMGAEEQEGLWSCGICWYCGPDLPPPTVVVPVEPKPVFGYRKPAGYLEEHEWRNNNAIVKLGEFERRERYAPRRNPFLSFTRAEQAVYLRNRMGIELY